MEALFGLIIFLFFIALFAVPLLLMAHNNDKYDVPQEVVWHEDYLTFGNRTLKYADAEYLAFTLRHDTAKTNGVWTTYDAYAYAVNLSGIVVARSHEAYKGYNKPEGLINEYQDIVAKATQHILPVIFRKAVKTLENNGKLTIDEVTFHSNGTVSFKNKTYKATDLETSYYQGNAVLRNKAVKTVFGNPKEICKASLANGNVCLYEPLLRYLQASQTFGLSGSYAQAQRNRVNDFTL